jgi:hypothetical protein
MNSDSRYTENELFDALSKRGGWDKDSISKLARSAIKATIPGSFKNEEFRMRSYAESRECKPLKSFGLELLKLEDRTGRPPIVCGMRAIVPKRSAKMERSTRLDINSKPGVLKVVEFFTTEKALPVRVDDVYLLGNIERA